MARRDLGALNAEPVTRLAPEREQRDGNEVGERACDAGVQLRLPVAALAPLQIIRGFERL